MLLFPILVKGYDYRFVIPAYAPLRRRRHARGVGTCAQTAAPRHQTEASRPARAGRRIGPGQPVAVLLRCRCDGDPSGQAAQQHRCCAAARRTGRAFHRDGGGATRRRARPPAGSACPGGARASRRHPRRDPGRSALRGGSAPHARRGRGHGTRSVGSLVDASVLVDARNPGGLGDDWVVSVVTLGELEVGILVATDDATRARGLALLAAVLTEAPALPVDRHVAARYGELRASAARQPSNDLWIAATALAHDSTLVTVMNAKRLCRSCERPWSAKAADPLGSLAEAHQPACASGRRSGGLRLRRLIQRRQILVNATSGS